MNRVIQVTITEKPYDSDDGGPVFIVKAELSNSNYFLNEHLHNKSSTIVDEIRDWCVEQWEGEEYAFNPFDGKEIWVRSLPQAMAFKMRWDGKHTELPK